MGDDHDRDAQHLQWRGHTGPVNARLGTVREFAVIRIAAALRKQPAADGRRRVGGVVRERGATAVRRGVVAEAAVGLRVQGELFVGGGQRSMSRHCSAPVTKTFTGAARVRTPVPARCSPRKPSVSVTMMWPPLVKSWTWVHGPTVSATVTPRERQPHVLLERLLEKQVLPPALEQHRHLPGPRRRPAASATRTDRPGRAG